MKKTNRLNELEISIFDLYKDQFKNIITILMLMLKNKLEKKKIKTKLKPMTLYEEGRMCEYFTESPNVIKILNKKECDKLDIKEVLCIVDQVVCDYYLGETYMLKKNDKK